MTSLDRDAYIEQIKTYANYNKDTNSMGVSPSYDCADVATFLYDDGMKQTGTGRTYSDLTHNGNPLSKISEISSTDFFSESSGNIEFYSDKNFNNPNVEVGTVLVWQGPGYDPKTETGWNGHVATVVDVTRDSNNTVTNIKIIQGHTGGSKTEVVDITSQADLDSYVGTFLGFGEIGAGSTVSTTSNDK